MAGDERRAPGARRWATALGRPGPLRRAETVRGWPGVPSGWRNVPNARQQGRLPGWPGGAGFGCRVNGHPLARSSTRPLNGVELRTGPAARLYRGRGRPSRSTGVRRLVTVRPRRRHPVRRLRARAPTTLVRAAEVPRYATAGPRPAPCWHRCPAPSCASRRGSGRGRPRPGRCWWLLEAMKMEPPGAQPARGARWLS